MSSVESVEQLGILQLKELIRGSEDKHLLDLLENDDFLRIFVVGRKYNIKCAFETIKGYVKMRHVKHPDIYNMEPKSVRHVLESGFLGCLKHKDHLGRVVGFMRLAKIDLKTMECEDIIRAIILLVESAWDRMENLRNGQVFLADFSGYNLSIMTRYSIGQKIMLINIFWHNYPSKIKGLHAVNIPKLFTYAYSIIRPFLPEKFKKRARLHGKDLESFHEFISPEILPIWLGGKLSDEEAIDLDLVKRILS